MLQSSLRHLVLAAAVLSVAGPASALTIDESDAAAHAGETATVECAVAKVFTSKAGNTFINCGAPYPQQDFSGVIFKEAASQFPNPQQYEGKRIKLRGLIKLYQQRPEIILEAPAQIVLQ